jgi:hypothetical protein
VKPVIFEIISHGTMLLWCSIKDTKTSSPFFRLRSPQEYATRLTASVVPLTKTISAASFALMNLAIFSLVFSCNSVAS